MTKQTTDILIAILCIALVLLLIFTNKPLSDFDFGSGLVRCGVDGLSTSCGSVAK